jgi:pimeloyl-ACP methyl ester carboxylesterase
VRNSSGVTAPDGNGGRYVGAVTDPPAELPAEIDPRRFPTHVANTRGFRQAFVREGIGGVPLICVHGWPETKRIFWKVIAPLAASGFEVIAPDLRGFGESELGPDGLHDVVASALDLRALVHDVLGHERVVLLGGDFGGPIVQDLALRFPDWVDRLVLFNSPLPYDKARMSAMASRPAREASDYFVRQGTDADALAAELSTPEQRRRYIATFYTSRFWAHPGAFLEADAPPGRFGGSAVVDFHTEPFADGAKLRASFGAYESAFDPAARSGAPLLARNERSPALIMFGASDHVLYPDFDRMAAAVFARHVGPFLLRDCGHFVPWEAPHALTSGTIAFCSDLLPAREQ